MVDALVSGASVERRAGSSPVLGTRCCAVNQRNGEVAELVDALLWGGSDRWVVWVRVSSSSPKKQCFRTENLLIYEIAEIAQLVEHNLAKVGVASSSLVFRSWKDSKLLSFFCYMQLCSVGDSWLSGNCGIFFDGEPEFILMPSAAENLAVS